MAKPRHRSQAAGKSNWGKQLKPHQRTPLTTLSKAERTRLITRATQIQALVAQEDAGTPLDVATLAAAATALQTPPANVQMLVAQYRRYHAAYPDQHPATAFAPLPKPRRVRVQAVIVTAPEHRESQISASVPKGADIATVPEPERSRIIAFAARIVELNAVRAARQGPLPPGMLAAAAAALGCSEPWITKSMARQREYLAAYPDEPPAHAHTPRPVGRPKGRSIDPAVQQTIEQARVSEKWLSRNGRGGFDELRQPLRKKEIHELVRAVHGPVHSRRTTYRVLRDYEAQHPARVGVFDQGVEILQRHFPAIRNKVSGPGDRCQLDIRSFPIVVNYKGILCTVRGLWVLDDASDYVPAFKLLPAKNINTDGEIHTVDFTARHVRAVLARACGEVKGRWRRILTDNGSQFAKALADYMPFMSAADEEPTLLDHRRRRRPRGGGNIEVSLKMIDDFLATRPYYVREKDFRRSRSKLRKQDIRSFEEFVDDFKAFHYHWNHDLEPETNGPSRYDMFRAGPQKLLTVPPPAHPALFACADRRETRQPRIEGDCWFVLDSTRYVSFRTDAAIYEQFANASRAGRSLKLLVFSFDDGPDAAPIVLFSMDDEVSWDLAVPQDQRELSGRKHTALMEATEQKLEHGEAANLNAFYQKTILGAAGGPLVLNGLRRKKEFYHHTADGQQRVEPPTPVSQDTPDGTTQAALPDVPPAHSADGQQRVEPPAPISQDTPDGTAQAALPDAPSTAVAPPPANTAVAQPGTETPSDAPAHAAPDAVLGGVEKRAPTAKRKPAKASPPAIPAVPPAPSSPIPNFIEILNQEWEQRT